MGDGGVCQMHKHNQSLPLLKVFRRHELLQPPIPIVFNCRRQIFKACWPTDRPTPFFITFPGSAFSRSYLYLSTCILWQWRPCWRCTCILFIWFELYMYRFLWICYHDINFTYGKHSIPLDNGNRDALANKRLSCKRAIYL